MRVAVVMFQPTANRRRMPVAGEFHTRPGAISNRGAKSMAKSISCKDLGMNCDFTAKADTTEELLKAAAAHAKEAHGMDSIPADLMPTVQAAIRDV